jgi:hypothetical protein
MSPVEDEIEAIVELLRPPAWYRRRPATADEAQQWTERVAEAERRIVPILDGSAADRLALSTAMLHANVAGDTLAPRLVSFIDENDLPALVETVRTIRASIGWGEVFLHKMKTRLGLRGAARLLDLELLLDEVALQRPDLVPGRHAGRRARVASAEEGDPSAARPTFHLIFEEGPPQRHLRPIDRRHPTWRLPTEGPSYRLGGPGRGSCPRCGKPLIHLITLDRTLPALLGSLPELVLETCTNCWGPAYYQHDQDGRPTRIASEEIDEQFDRKNVPLKEQNVRLAPTPKRWLRQSDGNLFRLGGAPTWIQVPEFPKVPQTEREMQLLLQLDSGLPDTEGGSLQFGDGGLLYVFWDAETRVSCHMLQSY